MTISYKILFHVKDRAAYNMHVYVILAEEHKLIFSIFNHHPR